jgi:CheY-like chemotaxis protein
MAGCGTYHAVSMALTSLLVCADAEAVQVLSRILEDLGIEVEICGDPSSAQSRFGEQCFNALVVDCQDEPSALALIGHARAASHPDSVVIALVNEENQTRTILAQGANFLLYKPISRERALHSVRAARGLIRQERRLQPRIPVHTPTSLAHAGREDASATIIEVNENGLGIQTGDKLPPSCRVYFQFALPGNDSVIRLSGEVMWQDSSGRVGIRFANVPQASRRILQQWSQSHLTSKPDEQSVLNVSSTDEATVRLSAGLGLLSASSADRRNPTRHACSLGAEVCGADSRVPVRCNLSDIGTGGCYVETTEPFPEGTPIEIVVRTRDVKLCISGTVKSANRGFGMGIQFNLRNEEQKKQVTQLVACAESEPKLLG